MQARSVAVHCGSFFVAPDPPQRDADFKREACGGCFPSGQRCAWLRGQAPTRSIVSADPFVFSRPYKEEL